MADIENVGDFFKMLLMGPGRYFGGKEQQRSMERRQTEQEDEETARREQFKEIMLGLIEPQTSELLQGFSVPSEQMSVRPGMEGAYPDAEPITETQTTGQPLSERGGRFVDLLKTQDMDPGMAYNVMNMLGGPSALHEPEIEPVEEAPEMIDPNQLQLIYQLMNMGGRMPADLKEMGLIDDSFDMEIELAQKDPDLVESLVTDQQEQDMRYFQMPGGGIYGLDQGAGEGDWVLQPEAEGGDLGRAVSTSSPGWVNDSGEFVANPYYDETGGAVDEGALTSTVTNMRTNGTYGMAEQASRTYGVPMEVLLAVFSKESGGNTQAIGDGGDSYGMGQLNRVNWEAFGITDPQAFLNDPSRQVEITAQMLKNGFDRTGSWRDALRMYNGSGPMAEAYADDVWSRSQEIKGDRDMMPGTTSMTDASRWWGGLTTAEKRAYSKEYGETDQYANEGVLDPIDRVKLDAYERYGVQQPGVASGGLTDEAMQYTAGLYNEMITYSSDRAAKKLDIAAELNGYVASGKLSIEEAKRIAELAGLEPSLIESITEATTE